MKIVICFSILALTGCSGVFTGTAKNDPPEEPDASPQFTVPSSDFDAGATPAPTVNGDDAGIPTPAAGKNGADGKDSKIVRTWTCNFAVARFSPDTSRPTNCSDTIVKVDGWYYATESTNGDVFVRVGIDHGGLSPMVSSSSSYQWAGGTWEATNGADWLMHDVCAGNGDANSTGNWNFALNKAAATMTVKYVDSDVQTGAISITSPCVVKNF